MKVKMNGVLAGAFNAAMETVGIAWRIEQITPQQAADQIAANPDLLKKFGLSQKMSGDKDDQVNDKKGRPMTDHLARRMEADDWKWYLSIMYRLPNGGVVDGLTRLLASKQSGCSFWTLVYIAAEADDFKYFDEVQSGRSNKDFVLNGDVNVTPAQASIEATLLPQVFLHLESDTETSHTQVLSDQFLPVKDDYPEAVESATKFVMNRGAIPRKNMIALLHFTHVGGPRAKNPASSEALLAAYVTGMYTNVNGKQMYDLRHAVKANQHWLREDGILPALEIALDAAAEGLNFEFEYVKKVNAAGKKVVYAVGCDVKRPGRRKAKGATV